MSGALSGHIINGYYAREAANSQIITSGAMSFNSHMHGTPINNTPFSCSGAPLVEDNSAKIASLQAKLNQKLGPEYISQRPGPGGGPKLTYAEGWKIINLANEIFGFNGWSSSLVSLNVDFIDCNEEAKRFNVGVTAVVRVTLRDGVYHEDIGYGMLENSRSKAQALDKCKKEAVTDGLKRALRNFGNVLGNCLYDKSYAQEIVKIKVPPPKLDKSELHRRPEFEEPKFNIADLETKPLAISTPGPSISRQVIPQQHQVALSPQQIPPKQPASIPLHMRKEMTNFTSISGSNSCSPNAIVRISNISRNERIQDHVNEQDRQQPQQKDHSSRSADISTSTVDTSLNDISFMPKPEPDTEDSFGYSEDDAFLAAVDLEGDLGPPIEEEADTGRPIDYEDLPSRENSRSSAGNPRSEGQQAIVQKPPLARPPQPQNQNQNSVSMNASSAHSRTKRTSAPAGAFHFPPEMNPHQSGPSRPAPSTSNTGIEIGVKRPVDAISTGQPLMGQRQGSRPNAGMHQAVNGGRQVLGNVEFEEGGNVKRMRRQ